MDKALQQLNTLAREHPSSEPLSAEEAALLLAPGRGAGRILLAVSGGPDSTALMHLAALAGPDVPLPPLAVATVDHGLQEASRTTALGVIDQARGLGLEAHLLTWIGPKPSSGLQARARDARYTLLTGLATRIGATHLLTAHTLDDQAETMLFRMARGSGPLGLAGMRRSVARDGIIHERPFLAVPKQRLIDTCRSRGWPYVEDRANGDTRFARARLRRLLPLLAEEGLDAAALTRLGMRLARDEEALRSLAALVLRDIARPAEAGRMVLTAPALLAQPEAVSLRVLDMAMTDFARPGSPRLGHLEHLQEELIAAFRVALPLQRTLHGHIVSLTFPGTIEIRPERRRRRGTSNEISSSQEKPTDLVELR